MRVDYTGIRCKDNCIHGKKYRLAVISYDVDNEKEARIVERIADLMHKVYGWNVQNIYGSAQCEVEDREEYEEFVKVYKEVKKMFYLCEKFGF